VAKHTKSQIKREVERGVAALRRAAEWMEESFPDDRIATVRGYPWRGKMIGKWIYANADATDDLVAHIEEDED